MESPAPAPFLLLMASLALGWWISRAGGFAPTAGGKLSAVALLSQPMSFSGILFAVPGTRVSIASAIAVNLRGGAMAGGLLEVNAMCFGFRSLYGLAAVLYAFAFLLAWRARHRAQ